MSTEIKIMTELESYWKELCERADIEDNDSNQQDIVTLRYIFYNYARNQKLATFQTIGDIVGRDHSTAITGLKTYHKLMSFNDPYLFQMINRVESKNNYQVIICPYCKGYVLFEPVPVRSGLIYGQLIGRGYIVKYQHTKPMVKCECTM